MPNKLKEKIDKKYFQSEASKIEEKDVEKTIKNRKKILDKIFHSDNLKKYTEKGKLMFEMLWDYKKGTYRQLPWLTVASIVFSLLYVLNPLDIIPDFIPVIGYLDDLTVFTFGLQFIQKDLDKYLEWKKRNLNSETPETNPTTT